MTETIKTIDMTPPGLQTPAGIRRVNNATEALGAATTMLANGTADFFREHRTTMLEVARGVSIAEDDRAAFRTALHELDALISARDRKQDSFLRAVAGHPPTPEEWLPEEPDGVH